MMHLHIVSMNKLIGLVWQVNRDLIW